MLVIVSARRLDNDRIEIAVTRPHHDSNGMLEYRSEKEIREVLSNLGIYTENDRFSLESANTNGLKRAPEISSHGRSETFIAFTRVSIVMVIVVSNYFGRETKTALLS